MPKMTLTEDEASSIRKQREVKAMQAVAWNEAITECIGIVAASEGPLLYKQAIQERMAERTRKP